MVGHIIWPIKLLLINHNLFIQTKLIKKHIRYFNFKPKKSMLKLAAYTCLENKFSNV